MFHVIFVVSLVVFVVYWRKKNTLAKSLGDGYENDASFLQACKIKKYAGCICLGAVALSVVTQGSQLIDDIKNLFGLIYAITFFVFLYYWRKQYTAKKAAGENYSSDEKYIHFKKVKKLAGCVCLAGIVVWAIIPNSPEETQKQAEIHAKYEIERAREKAEKQAKEEEMKKEAEKEAIKHIENLQYMGKVFKGTDSSYEIENVDVNGNVYTVNYKMWTSVAGTSRNNIKLEWKNKKWELVE